MHHASLLLFLQLLIEQIIGRLLESRIDHNLPPLILLRLVP